MKSRVIYIQRKPKSSPFIRHKFHGIRKYIVHELQQGNFKRNGFSKERRDESDKCLSSIQTSASFLKMSIIEKTGILTFDQSLIPDPRNANGSDIGGKDC